MQPIERAERMACKYPESSQANASLRSRRTDYNRGERGPSHGKKGEPH